MIKFEKRYLSPRGFIVEKVAMTSGMYLAIKEVVFNGSTDPVYVETAKNIFFSIDNGMYAELSKDSPAEVWNYADRKFGSVTYASSNHKKPAVNPDKLYFVAVWDHKIRAIFEGEAKVGQLPKNEEVQLHKVYAKTRAGALKKAAESLFVQISDDV